MVFPGPDWQESTPEAQGIDSKKLENSIRYLENNSGLQGTSQVIVIVNGFIIWKGNDIDNKHDVWSCTKSFTSTVLGLLIDDEKCTLDSLGKDYDTNLDYFYPDLKLRHFATMTSGYNAIGDDQSSWPFDVSDPLYTPPGSANDYWDAAMDEMAYVLTIINGGAIDTLFKERIADPIGMASTKWSWGDFGVIDGIKVNGGAGNYTLGISISASEMARFGHLFLNRGCWDGVQIISSSWVDQATRLQVPISVPWSGHRIDVNGQYGFNWWVNDLYDMKWNGAPEGTYAAVGYNNNKLFVIPKWRMVVVRLGTDGSIADDIWGVFFSLIDDARQNAQINYQGDIDNDGDVDGTDLAAMIKYFGQADCHCFCPEDLNRDGAVDDIDLAIFVEDFSSVLSPVPAITTAPVLEGKVGFKYQYDVNASGIPAPDYRLLSTPGGMVIDGVSGLIEWVPAAAGLFDVTVEAFNTQGSDIQSFTINVTTISSTLSIWSPGVTVGPDNGTSDPFELGVKFRADVNGYIKGIRFYKYPGSTGTHYGNLWTTTGTNLGQVIFTGETASGWQQANFATPISITANTTYIASCHFPNAHFSNSTQYFTSTGVDNPPLHALKSGVDGANGVYRYGSTTGFPNQSWKNSNYWVDVVFEY
jgi:CubicO group peptidase (beta-lactamase class C family)